MNEEQSFAKSIEVYDWMRSDGYKIQDFTFLNQSGKAYFKFTSKGAEYVTQQLDLALPCDLDDSIRVYIMSDTESFILVEASDYPTLRDYLEAMATPLQQVQPIHQGGSL